MLTLVLSLPMLEISDTGAGRDAGYILLAVNHVTSPNQRLSWPHHQTESSGFIA
ncbi:hypothetical protein J6590_063185 [Homalodisca vitripennis]|nr:hypothetical protein J6590_063185 [Homalodisca vitripennis]